MERRRRAEAWKAILATRQPALASLERAGWPGGTMVSLQRRTMFGGSKRYSKAGWPVASYRYRWKDTNVDSTVYLLSDGRLCEESFGPAIVLEGTSAEHIVEGDGLAKHFPLAGVKRGLERLAARG